MHVIAFACLHSDILGFKDTQFEQDACQVLTCRECLHLDILGFKDTCSSKVDVSLHNAEHVFTQTYLGLRIHAQARWMLVFAMQSMSSLRHTWV